MATITTDRSSQVKAFEESKTGVKGLVDSGITEIPAIFRAPLDALTTLKPPPTPTPQLTIPTIDLKGGVYSKNQDSATRRSVVEKVGDAGEKWGFFQVFNHGIPLDVLEKIREGIRGFHEQDNESKKPLYSRDHTKKLLYYSNVDLQNARAASWRDTLGCYMAPDPPSLEDLPAVCGEIMLEYKKEIMNLGDLLFELLSETLGFNPNHLKDMDCNKSMIMFGQYYPPCPQPDLTLGLSKHTDFSFLTIVLEGNIGGLQVLHDQYWINVPPNPEAFVVNIGDLLQILKHLEKNTNQKVLVSNHPSISKDFPTNFPEKNMELEGARKNNMEEEEEAVMEERIYVAVGREIAKNKSNLTWVIDNSKGNKICIVLVHQPAQMIPVLGTKFDAATVDEELVRAYREKQKARTEKILDEYLRICLRKGVQAEKMCVEMNSIEKGIVHMISENRVRKFIMGAAADKHYSMKMEDLNLRSKKAIFVCQHATATCHIRFICKGHLIHTREARMDEVRALSALLSDFQRLVSSQSRTNSDMHSGSSKGKSEKEEEEEEEEKTSRTSSSRSAGTLSYFGGSEASSSVTDEKSNHSSPPSLPCTGMGLGMINFLVNSTKLWQRLAIQNHKTRP